MTSAPRPLRLDKTSSGALRLFVLDQTRLPYEVHWLPLDSLDAVAGAIRRMQVRGAPLIGVVAAYGVALALSRNARDAGLARAVSELAGTRPTAVNLQWALARMQQRLIPLPPERRLEAAWREADAIAEADAAQNRAIGQHGLTLLQAHARERSNQKDRPLQIMTHCNAGWLATVEQGTALAPLYAAHAEGMALQVWVSETRPRNQGLLTAWELSEAGIPYTVVADNAAGFLMAEGQVDVVITGADRVAANGDVANKIGTCLKALAARHWAIPFYVAAPGSTLDFQCADGRAIPIEARDGDELRLVDGLDAANCPQRLRQISQTEPVANPAFDITPAELVTALITERGIAPASWEGLSRLYPELRHESA